jgi:hypothetical protein
MKGPFICIALIILLCTKIQGQSASQADSAIFTTTEVSAEFPGGLHAFYQYIQNNLSFNGNSEAVNKMIAKFVIEKDGSISHVTIVKSSGSAETDKALIGVLTSMPKWKPAESPKGTTVRQYWSLPLYLCKR